MKHQNGSTRKWSAADDTMLIAAYKANVPRNNLGEVIGWSRNAAVRHLNYLIESGRLQKRQSICHKFYACDADCDHCKFSDCITTDQNAVRIQKKQDSERYSRLPACDRRVIDYRKKLKGVEIGSMSKMDRPLSRRQMGDYIRDKLDQAHEVHPEGDVVSRKAMEYGHRKPYSGSQYYLQSERDKHSYEVRERQNKAHDEAISNDGKHCPHCGAAFYITNARYRNLSERESIDIACNQCQRHFKVLKDTVEDPLDKHERWKRGEE